MQSNYIFYEVVVRARIIIDFTTASMLRPVKPGQSHDIVFFISLTCVCMLTLKSKASKEVIDTLLPPQNSRNLIHMSFLLKFYKR